MAAVSAADTALLSDLKRMIREVVKDTLADPGNARELPHIEEVGSPVSPDVADADAGKLRAKGENAKLELFDLSREMGPDPQDPRNDESQWPCFAKHVEGMWSGNQFGRWRECDHCGVRLVYQPKISASGKYVKKHSARHIALALQLSRECFPRKPCSGNIKAAIKIVSAQKVMKEDSAEHHNNNEPVRLQTGAESAVQSEGEEAPKGFTLVQLEEC